MKLREWVRRMGSGRVIIFLLGGLLGVSVMGLDCLHLVHIHMLTAHAQKPAEPSYSQVGKHALVIGHNPDGSWELSAAFYRAVEQHCVAIYPDEHFVIPGHTLEIRCTSGKEKP